MRKPNLRRVRPGTRFGKYKVRKLLGSGGFANVYEATDTVEGLRVALKVPHAHLLDAEVEDSLGREIRIAVRLEHPHVLSPRNAEHVNGRLVIAYPMGDETLADRLRRRISADRALHFAGQMISGLAHAHGNRVIHCDVKPENFLLFGEGSVRLTDFGISKTAARTLRASGSGTVGYMAPEQAMGRPSFRSDVFSMGLVCYRMFSGKLPEWPFDRPHPDEERIRRRFSAKIFEVLRRAIATDPKKRFADAVAMLAAFETARAETAEAPRAVPRVDWRTVRSRQFFARHADQFPHRTACSSCEQPVGETMRFCPWCGEDVAVQEPRTSGRSCGRCLREVKSDWRYCPWCWGPAIGDETTRRWSDPRYVARCQRRGCREMTLMPFMRYCPRCHASVKRKWKLTDERATCGGCGHGVAPGYWDHCAWCGRGVERR